MKSLKKFFCAFACVAMLLVLSQGAFAYGGYMEGEDDVRIVSTKYFDIIFPVESARSAYMLSQQADEIFEDICRDMEMEPWFRMPVVITQNTDVFNAYYTFGSYNHIVLFDAIPEEDMQVFDESIINTFKHELTHAATISDESEVLQKVTGIFGDIYNYGQAIILPSLIKEGASVAYESKTGQGRLNDDYYLHMARQAKLMGKFPKWSEAKGARDIFPSGSDCYGFGGPFTEYIQKQYGMTRYALFWYKCVNYQTFTMKGAFKKVYGITLDQAWDEFKTALKVPEVDPDPLAVEGVEDVFADSNINSHMGLYEKVAACDNGIALLDSSSRNVYWMEKLSDGSYGKPKKLFNKAYTYDISLSSDGKFMAVCSYGLNYAAYKTEVSIYSMEDKCFYNLKETGLRSAAVVQDKDYYYLVAAKTKNQGMSLKVFSIQLDGKGRKVKDVSCINELFFNIGDTVSSVVDSGDGEISAIYKSGLEWSIRTWKGLLPVSRSTAGGKDVFQFESDTAAETKYSLPEGTRIRGLSCYVPDHVENGRKVFAFSYTQPGNFPRLGILSAVEGKPSLSLMNVDVSGGVYTPVASKGSQFIYSAYLYDEYRIYSLDSSVVPFVSATTKVSSSTVVVNDEKAQQSVEFPAETFLASAEKYKKVLWNRGSWLPLSNVKRFVLSNEYVDQVIAQDMMSGIGISWMTNSPWDGMTLTASADYQTVSRTLGLGVQLAGGTTTSKFTYSEDLNVVLSFDSSVLSHAANMLAVQSSIEVGRFSSIIMSESNNAFAGRSMYTEVEDPALGTMTPTYNYDKDWYLYDKNVASLAFSTLHKTGSSVYDVAGISFGVDFIAVYLDRLGKDGLDPYYNNLSWFNTNRLWLNVGLSATICIPQLIPVECGRNFTYNLPLRISASLLDDVNTFARARAELCLFEMELQKGWSWLPFYFNRFLVTGHADVSLGHPNSSMEILRVYDALLNDPTYLDASCGMDISLISSLNFGSLAGSQFKLGCGFEYIIESPNEYTSPWQLSLSGSLLF